MSLKSGTWSGKMDGVSPAKGVRTFRSPVLDGLFGLLTARCLLIADLECAAILSVDFAASSGSTGVVNNLESMPISTDSSTRGADTRDCETHGRPIIGRLEYAKKAGELQH